MTVQDLYDKINELIDAELARLDSLSKANYMARRAAILGAVRDLWDAAAINPRKDDMVGNITYVSRAEAFKYGRIDKLNALVNEQAKLGALTDISNLEKQGIKIYTTQYDGYAWAYSQGYALPITGGAKVPLVAAALYSDFYGAAFDKTVRKNLGAYAEDIISTVTRELNQGHAYSKIAKAITEITDRSYSNALRVASTEGGRIQSQAYVDSLALLDDVGAEYGEMWQSTIDDKTRSDHIEMDGKMADNDGIFHLPGGATGPAPRMTGVAKQDIFCRCTAVTIVNGENPTERRVRGEGIIGYETYKERLERGGDIPIRDVRKARK
jgi:hypothetical protein